MFAIYDIEGCNFRGTLESLRKVRRKQTAQKASFQMQGMEDNSRSALAGRSISARAFQAYREKLPVREREAIVHAHQIMSHPVETVQMTLDIVSAWKGFQKQNRHQKPVLDSSKRIVGMLSERDLLQFLIIDDDIIQYQRDKTVADAMSVEAITADPVSDIRRIAKVMLDYRLSAIPICDERDELIGLVSRSDVLRAVALDPPLSLWT